MKTLLVLGLLAGCGAALYSGVVTQSVVKINTARAAELAHYPSILACQAAGRAWVASQAGSSYSSATELKLGAAILKRCQRVNEEAHIASFRRLLAAE